VLKDGSAQLGGVRDIFFLSCNIPFHVSLHTVHDATFGGGEALFASEARLNGVIQDVPKPPSLQYGWD